MRSTLIMAALAVLTIVLVVPVVHANPLYSGSNTTGLLVSGYAFNATPIGVYVSGHANLLVTLSGANASSVSVNGVSFRLPGKVYGGGYSIASIYYDYSGLNGTGGYARLVYYTPCDSNNSVVLERISVFASVEKSLSGIVVFEVELYYSNSSSGSLTGPQPIYYNYTRTNYTETTPFITFNTRGNYTTIILKWWWLPDSNNTSGNVNVTLGIVFDGIIAVPYPRTPQALVQYSVYPNETSYNATLTTNATTDYYIINATITFPDFPGSTQAYYPINITYTSIPGYNITAVLDGNYEPLPWHLEGGNITVLTPMVNQTIHIIYTKNTILTNGTYRIPLNHTVFLAWDYGDANSTGEYQGWSELTSTDWSYSVSQDPLLSDYSLNMTLTSNVYYSLGGFYYDAIVPKGNYTVIADLRVEPRLYFGGEYYMIFFMHDAVNDTYPYAILAYGTTTIDGTFNGRISLGNYCDRFYWTMYVIYARSGTASWIRWVILWGDTNQTVDVTVDPPTHIYYNTTYSTANTYYLLFPASTDYDYLDVNETISLVPVAQGSYTIFNATSNTLLNMSVQGVEGGLLYYNNVIIPAGYSNATLAIQVNATPLGIQVVDPPLANATILAILYNATNATTALVYTNATGYALVPLNASNLTGAYNLTIVPLVYPYTSPYTIIVYYDIVNATFQQVYLPRNSTTTMNVTAFFKYSGIPVTGTLNITWEPGINITNPITIVGGNGTANVTSYSLSGTYNVSAVNATVAGIIFPAVGNGTIIVTGAHIIILINVTGPPYYVYSIVNITVIALYDDNSTAVGNGTILVQIDHYNYTTIAWNGSKTNITLSLGYDTYVNATLIEPTGQIDTNDTLFIAVPLSNSLSGGVQLVSLTATTLQTAALEDIATSTGLLLFSLALTLYTPLRKRIPITLRLLLHAIIGIVSLLLVPLRSEIITNWQIIQLANGTITAQPVYTANYASYAYFIPMTVSLFLAIEDFITILENKIFRF